MCACVVSEFAPELVPFRYIPLDHQLGVHLAFSIHEFNSVKPTRHRHLWENSKSLTTPGALVLFHQTKNN